MRSLLSEYHGTYGPLVVSDSIAAGKLTSAFIGAAQELGYHTMDVNGENQMGKKEKFLN